MELINEPQQPRAKRQLKNIADAAIRVIEKEGRDYFTTGQVASAAGVSIGLIYRYFADRGALLRWLYPDAVQGLGEPRDLTYLEPTTKENTES